MVALTPAERTLVTDILSRCVPGRQVAVFGSRATGHQLKPFSDLDLVILGDAPLPCDQLGDLREAFSASDLPFRVDIVEWACLTQEFCALIQSQLVPLFTPDFTPPNPPLQAG
jgi:predicted nucleotidyltransferase